MKYHHAPACAATVLALASFGVSAAPLQYAEATFDNLHYRLVDLDANDGITPWIQFEAAAGVNLKASRVAGISETAQNVLGGTPFSASSGSASLPYGLATAQAGANRMSAKIDGTFQDLSQGPFAQTAQQTYGSYVYERTAQATTRGDLNSWTKWVLSPNTQLIIEGDLTMTTKTNAEQLLGTVVDQAFQNSSSGLSISSSSQAALYLESTNAFGVKLSGAYDSALAINNQLLFQGTVRPWQTSPQWSSNVKRTMSVELSNVGTQDMTGRFFAWAWARGTSQSVVPVPEPSSLIMLGSGALVLLALGRRRG